jgi:succinate dehydrogenase (ubiquinone) cytochrome b560 subunit
MSLGVGTWYFTGDFEKFYETVQTSVHPHVLWTIKVIVAFPYVYHICTGIRHLIWDTGRGLTQPTINRTGYAILLFALMGSMALANAGKPQYLQ